ncbi:MAG: B12-binding domain-containing radical SAM protein [Desulfomonilia bacterium]
MVLIHPPLTRPCEPPPGLAKIAGALKDHEIRHLVIDSNIEALVHLLSTSDLPRDTWTRRSALHLHDNLRSLKDGSAFRNTGAYSQAVTELSRILDVRARPHGYHMNLSNLTHRSLSPVRSTDLLHAAENPEENVFYPYFRKRLQDLLEDHSPQYMGFSLNYLSQALTTFAMIGYVKTLNPDTKILLGGGLVTSWVRGPLRSTLFEGVVDTISGEPGEDVILSLLEKPLPSGDITPDFEVFSTYEYLSPGRVFPFSTSTGCYWGTCSFCPERAEGTRFTHISLSSVPSLLEDMIMGNPQALIHFCDNAMSPSLLTGISRKGLSSPWYGFARFTPHLAEADFCSSLRKSGCVMLQLGLESGDQSVLDELEKGIRLDTAAQALKNLKRSGIATYVYLLFGTPSEDYESALKTLDFVAVHHESIDFLNLSIFNLPRNSPDAARHQTYDFTDGDLSLYQGFVHPKGWDRNRVRQFLDKEFKRNRAIARIVRRDPPFFTSNHAPFFAITAQGSGNSS